MSDAPATPRRKFAGKLALVGIVLILLGFGAASGVGGIFAGQDPAGEAMMGGLLFAFFAGCGLIVLIVAAIMALKERPR